ncbi:hypothetical protein R3P38DRAFT_2773244 [Favolaschia claudopus]|uniref:Uncharacterized protein n=1 Tax=Favolaschia claudopus TaxID=2862362 RepID=A0AAW0C1U1_9AGAR
MAQGMGLGSLGSPAPVFHNFGPSRSSSLSSSSLSHNRHRARSTASNLSAHTGSASASDWSGLGMQDDDSGSCPSPNSFLGNQDFGSPRLGWFSGSQGSASPDPLVSQVQSLSTELGNVKASLSPLHSKVDQLLELLRNPRDPKHAVWILEAGDAFRRQPRIAPGSPQLAELQARYPSVEIWDPEDFNDKDDVRRVSKGGGTDKKNDINNSGRYIEHMHGGVIGGKELGEINASLNLLLNDVHTAGKSTPRLRHMGHEVMGAIIFMLENEYPYLGLCSNHWKAKRVISMRYRHWAKAQGLIGENEENEGSDGDGGSDNERMVGTKHKPRAGTVPARKRTKANASSSTKPSSTRPQPPSTPNPAALQTPPPPPANTALEPPANSAPQLPPVSAPPPNPTPPLAPAIAPPPSAFIPPPTPAIAPPPPNPVVAPPPSSAFTAPPNPYTPGPAFMSAFPPNSGFAFAPPPNPVVAPPPSSAFTAPLNPAFAPPPNPPVAPPPNSVVARQYTPGPAFMSAFPPNSGFAFAPPPNPVVAPPPSSAFTAPPNPAVAPPPNTPSSLPLDLGFAPPPHGVITPPNTITTPPPNPALAPPNTAMAPPPNPAPTAVPLVDEEPDLFNPSLTSDSADIDVSPPSAPLVITTTPAPAPIVSKAGGKEASPNPTMFTARNLCLAVWCAEVGGPIASFNIHWDGIKKDKKLYQAYDSYARSLKRSSAETIPEVGVIRNTVGLPLATNTPASSSAPQGGTGMGRE